MSSSLHNLAKPQVTSSVASAMSSLSFMPPAGTRVTHIQTISHAASGEFLGYASGFVDGYVKDRWAFQQLNYGGKRFAVATSTGYLGGTGEFQAKNHLFVLKQEGSKMDISGSVQNFGINENIRSVRYFNKMAYVVTFKKTDPLFAISLEDPDKPVILGELKIPGFSTYMQPLSDTLLAGVGFDAAEAGDFAWYQGIKLSLFDITSPTKLSALDAVVLGDRGSFSEATRNAHAFFYDPDEKVIGLPVTLLKNAEQMTGSQRSQPTPIFSGAIFYDVSRNKLDEIARVSHQEWIPAHCQNEATRYRWWESVAPTFDIARLFKIDGNYVSLSPFGLKKWNGAIAGQLIAEEKFRKDDSAFSCQNQPNVFAD